MKKYIFGYGSLQNFSSIKKTIFENKNITDVNINNQSEKDFDNLIQIVRVKNIKRGWYFHCDLCKNKLRGPWTALGAYECENYTCNGTLFPVDDEQLKLLDIRESGYIRNEIEKKNISIIKGYGIPKNSIIYYYSVDPSNIKNPSSLCPIIQTYVDICMVGCIDIDYLLGNKNYEFTNEFVNTTYNWKKNKYLKDTRNIECTNYKNLIDNILNDNLFID